MKENDLMKYIKCFIIEKRLWKMIKKDFSMMNIYKKKIFVKNNIIIFFLSIDILNTNNSFYIYIFFFIIYI